MEYRYDLSALGQGDFTLFIVSQEGEYEWYFRTLCADFGGALSGSQMGPVGAVLGTNVNESEINGNSKGIIIPTASVAGSSKLLWSVHWS